VPLKYSIYIHIPMLLRYEFERG